MDTVLWRTADDRVVTVRRSPRESQTRGAVEADDGDRGDLSQITLESDTAYASRVPVLTPWGPDHTREPSLEYGHHVYSVSWWFYLPGFWNGLVQSVCTVMRVVDHHSCGLL